MPKLTKNKKNETMPSSRSKLSERYNLSLPGVFKPVCEEFRDDLGSFKSVFEYALRKYFNKNPRNYDKGDKGKWDIQISIPSDIKEEILQRIPHEFKTVREGILISLLNLIHEQFG